MTEQRPKDLVFTLFGEYLLDVDAVWVGSLIALLDPFGLRESAVRTALSRMVKKGWLLSRRVGRNSYYSLTPKGRRLLEEGQARIYRPEWTDEWDGTWFLLAYSLPQDARRARDRLRDRLAWLGFGSIGNGLWISPHDVSAQVAALARRMGIEERVVTFHARRVDGDASDLVRRCWDLDGLDAEYRAFTERWRAIGDTIDGLRDGPASRERCFVLRFRLIHEFRRFPLEDPYLPRELLPRRWAGDEASALFRTLHDRLAGPADAWVEALLSDAPSPPGGALASE